MRTLRTNKQMRNKIGLYFLNESKPDPRLDPTLFPTYEDAQIAAIAAV